MTAKTERRRRAVAGFVLAAVCGLCSLAASGQAPDGQPSASSPSDYRIGPGDTLNVVVWRQPDLSALIQVRPDGKISTPQVEDMQAIGKTPTQLARDIEGVLAEILRTPQVTVMVEGFVGVVDSQIRVIGEVVMPGAFAYRDGMTLLDVVLAAGGLTDFARGNRSKLTRMVDGELREIRIRLKDLMDKGDLSVNMPMLPGDVVVVPEAVI